MMDLVVQNQVRLNSLRGATSGSTSIIMLFALTSYELRVAVKVLHYAFPALVFFYFGIAHAVTICTLQTQSLRVQDQKVRRGVIIALILAVAGTYVRDPEVSSPRYRRSLLFHFLAGE
jgi:hypothetical protein